MTLSGINSGSSSATDQAGSFCPAQFVPGAFGQGTARTINQTGVNLNPLTFTTTLAGNFCIPATGNGLIDGIVDLPGPGSVSIPGSIQVCLGLLCLPL